LFRAVILIYINPDINYLDILPEYFLVWNDYPDILLSGMIIQIFSCLEWLSRYFVVWNGYLAIFLF